MKKLTALFCAFMLVFSISGCGGVKSQLKYDDFVPADAEYDESLFFRNDLELLSADPQVIYIEDEESTEYGYYYLYATTEGANGRAFWAWRSKDLISWENVSELKGYPIFYPTTDHFGSDYMWAPECIYDAETDKYYLYYSCRNRSISTGTTVRSQIGLLISDEPYGPFVAFEDETHNASTPLFEEDKIQAAVAAAGGVVTPNFICIDPSPFVAPDGTKYLLFNRDRYDSLVTTTTVWGIKMNSWTDPDYSTLTQLTRANYMSMDENAERTPTDMEMSNNYINEGPFMFYSEQEDGSYRYYLTFSANFYTNKTYCVLTAVGTSPLGPFTKVNKEDGGILIGTDGMSWDHISGPGHHSFMKIGNELFIIYHEHIERREGQSQRAIAIDRVHLVKNSKGEEMLYANGPTWSLQPLPEAVSEYKNIASEAKVSAGRDVTELSALTDGLLSLYSYIDYVKETQVRGKSTITFKFDDYREVKGLMIYNSKNFENTFYNVESVELDFYDKEQDVTGTAYIDDLAFDWEFYKGVGHMMRPGGSSVAVFSPLMVKEIRFTFNTKTSRVYTDEDGEENYTLCVRDDDGNVINPEWIGISEIVVLGK